eukprot:CAMPEP_0119104492 /NCGR_PEP_ID=MMETSP1180-20130426/2693_1 /TAXON_ID=3052 ORGANISM="Chlamydomonas cf sp, Strain CCMP681" /NCGR_SAMPLE_ID=MMETSP1180 /ASSEMBLY_ACC=CAM_ASM_000741 /LENGTH=130 /DNA_ID=CAMNT_0007089267 /DNA_START=150 /DNA_END=542 /DNA_ORIENTATION=-
MTQGRLVKWLKAPGERVGLYDVLCEVSTEEIAEKEFRVGDFAGVVTLVVEAHDEGFMAAHLHAAGEQLQVGVPIAVLCEEEEQVAAAAAFKPIANVYSEPAPGWPQQPQPAILAWQAHLAKGSQTVKCMG